MRLSATDPVRAAAFLLAALFFATPAHAETAYKEYLDAEVLLIDHETGHLGIRMEGPDGETKAAVKADPVRVQVLNTLNQELAFSDIQVGDQVDVVALPAGEGELENAVEILDYTRFVSEA